MEGQTLYTDFTLPDRPVMHGALYNVPVDRIRPNPNNPRKNFDPAALEELAASIREIGILQPLLLVEDGGEYRIVAGERRWRAARLAGLQSVPALISKLTPRQEAEIMLIENLQRKDLDPIEEARAYQALLKEHGYTQEALGEKLGVSQAHIANRIRLLDLPKSIQENISRGIISTSHGKVLAGYKRLPEPVLKKVVKEIVERDIPVAKTEQVITGVVAEDGMPLYKHFFNSPVFDVEECSKCKHRVVVHDSWNNRKLPYCMNKPCWENKQAWAQKMKQQEEAEEAEAEARVAREEAAKKKAENQKRQVEVQEQIQKAAGQIARVSASNSAGLNSEMVELIKIARAAWEEEIKNRPYSIADCGIVDRESIITLEGLLEYWRTKNEICREATSMSPQLGEAKVIIPEQGVMFHVREFQAFQGSDNNRGCISVENGMLRIADERGHLIDRCPELPVYYRIKGNNAGTKCIMQMLAFKTPGPVPPARVVLVFGNDNVTMRKEIYVRWIQLINELPPVPEEMGI
jgi:ParB family chromosome partitioning protein